VPLAPSLATLLVRNCISRHAACRWLWLLKVHVESGVFPHMLTMSTTDDSHLNCKHAEARGWTVAHLVEAGTPIPRVPASRYLISSLHELPVHFPGIFKPQEVESV
jgi:hypothetical protein